MGKVKMIISLTADTAEYLRSTTGVSSTIEEAVAEYRARDLERELAAAYRDGADESERLNDEWQATEAEVVE